MEKKKKTQAKKVPLKIVQKQKSAIKYKAPSTEQHATLRCEEVLEAVETIEAEGLDVSCILGKRKM